jgi:hypothetical protein
LLFTCIINVKYAVVVSIINSTRGVGRGESTGFKALPDLRQHACIQGCAGVCLHDFGSLYLRAQNRSQLYPVRHVMSYTHERIYLIFQPVKSTNKKEGNDS